MPMPFNLTLAVARLQTDSTDALRKRYPHLEWAWDELDELRAFTDEVQEQLETLQKGVLGAVEEYEQSDDLLASGVLINSLKELTNDA